MSKLSPTTLFFALVVIISTAIIAISFSLAAASKPSSSSQNQEEIQIHHIRKHLDGLSKTKKPIPSSSSSSSANGRKKPTLQTRIANKDLIRFFKGHNIAENCTVCQNQEDCCGGESCCDGGNYCCEVNMTCCEPTCCQSEGSGVNSETCCPDTNAKYGGVCCENEGTKCCPPDVAGRKPSRCCPRWSICCTNGGRFGCCDPTTLRPIEETESVQLAHALLLEPEWTGNMKFDAATINLASGNYTQVKISNLFDTFGETPRSFTYDNNRDVFYLPQANFTNEPKPHSDDPDRAIHLYTIDGLSGAVTRTKVTGADDLVTGYAYVPSQDVIVLSTVYYVDTSKTQQGYKFYHLDPKNANAKQVAEFKIEPKSQFKYDGWFHAVSRDLKFVFRLGFQDVKTSSNFGLGVTDISVNPPKTSWVSVSGPPGHNNYKSLTLASAASPTVTAHFSEGEINALKRFEGDEPVFFLSLAGSSNATRYNDLDLFLWPLQNPSSAKSIAKFANAHTTPDFGPIQEALSDDGTQYTALVVCDSEISSTFDTWCLVSATTQTNTSSVNVENTLNPMLLAETVSVAGLGIPKSTKIWNKRK